MFIAASICGAQGSKYQYFVMSILSLYFFSVWYWVISPCIWFRSTQPLVLSVPWQRLTWCFGMCALWELEKTYSAIIEWVVNLPHFCPAYLNCSRCLSCRCKIRTTQVCFEWANQLDSRELTWAEDMEKFVCKIECKSYVHYTHSLPYL